MTPIKLLDLDNKATQLSASFLSGALASLALPPWGYWPLLFVGLSLYYLSLEKIQSPKIAALAGFFFGFAYFLSSLEWVGNALLVEGNDFAWVWPLAICGLPTALGLYFSLHAYLSKKLFNLSTITGFLAFCALLGFIEYLRGHLFTGFPWNYFAYSLADHLPLIQVTSLINVYGLNLLSIVWTTSIAIVWIKRKHKKVAINLFLFATLTLLTTYTYGYYRLKNNPTTYEKGSYITIVQPNIAQSDKWKRDKIQDNFNTLVELSNANTTGKNIILWPETATSIYILNHPENQKLLSTRLQQSSAETYLIAGILNHSEETGFSNEIILFDNQLNPLEHYKKTKLVPFGEFIPFQEYIPLAPVANFRGFGEGSGASTYNIPDFLSYKPLICYEIIFPDFQSSTQPAPDIIINSTNDAWYGISAGPYQHFTHAIFRAIESGSPVMRSANTGISAIIDSYGRTLQKLDLNQKGSLTTPIPSTIQNKLLSNQGQTLLFYILLILLILPITYKSMCISNKN